MRIVYNVCMCVCLAANKNGNRKNLQRERERLLNSTGGNPKKEKKSGSWELRVEPPPLRLFVCLFVRSEEQSGSSDVNRVNLSDWSGAHVCHQITANSANSIFVIFVYSFPSLSPLFGGRSESQRCIFYYFPTLHLLFVLLSERGKSQHVNNCSYVYFGKQ